MESEKKTKVENKRNWKERKPTKEDETITKIKKIQRYCKLYVKTNRKYLNAGHGKRCIRH